MGFRSRIEVNINYIETKSEKEEEGTVGHSLDACVCSGVCGGAESHQQQCCV